MSKVFMDNMTFDTAFLQLNDDRLYKKRPKLCHESCLDNLLTSIVFWNEIQFPKSTNRIIDQFKDKKNEDGFAQLYEICKHDVKIDVKQTVKEGKTHYEETAQHKLVDEDSLIEHELHDQEGLIRRVLDYRNACFDNGLNYIPHPLRLNYLINDNRKFRANKKEIKKIEEMIGSSNYLNKIFKETGAFDNKIPDFLTYIKEKAGSENPMHLLHKALELREREDVKEYRTVMYYIDEAYKKDDKIMIKSYEKEMNRLVSSIANECRLRTFARSSIPNLVSIAFKICLVLAANEALEAIGLDSAKLNAIISSGIFVKFDINMKERLMKYSSENNNYIKISGPEDKLNIKIFRDIGMSSLK